MNLQDRLTLCRHRLDDAKGTGTSRLWKDWELVEYASDADDELARRLYLLSESDTVGYLTITGTAGSVNSVTVTGVNLIGSPVAYTSSPETTAILLAAAITAYASSPKYRARAVGNRVLVRAVPQTGYSAAGYSLAATATTLNVTATTTTGLCRHELAANQRYIQLHDGIVKIVRAKPSARPTPLSVYRKDELDSSVSDWETAIVGDPLALIVDYDSFEAIIYPPVKTADVLEIDCYRLPFGRYSVDRLWEAGEIPARYDMAKIDWMLRQAYLKDDADTLDLAKSSRWEKEFDRRVEDWRIERVRNTPGSTVNAVPLGLL